MKLSKVTGVRDPGGVTLQNRFTLPFGKGNSSKNLVSLGNISQLQKISQNVNSSPKLNGNKDLKVSLWNARSLGNKIDLVNDYLGSENLDLMFFTECWLKPDDIQCRELENNGNFSFILNSRNGRPGGGVGCLYRSGLKVRKLETTPSMTFEHLALDLDSKVIVLLVYRSEPSPKNRYTLSSFFSEFSDMIAGWQSDKRELLVLGDFNFHMNKPELSSTKKLKGILNMFNLNQLVSKPTHIAGNILDLVITHELSHLVYNLKVDELLSDHNSILFDLKISQPKKPRKRIKYRKTCNMNLADFKMVTKASESCTCSKVGRISQSK